ncbi:2,3-diketo-L-gulonate TRAP transporter small permease protein YiaM [Roseivivax jejudonensis]|uniref:TRAP transporter small permease protein n=1 Tax=Roseivivax jejudonensis TaxID=1529041 RepID=A0A1X6Y432_9RHOB|nr:TRAP transporter small permease [Roseivivax jejudonensis]SLN10046.1 2,3-diketo-L-gulonate TRAP transporter small permease protein YiaM [Roseivivax jejudonensis]
MDAFDRYLTALNKALVALLLAATFAVVIVNVVMRYGFGTSFAWGEEVARFLMIAGAFFGAGIALREGRLVAITVLQDVLPGMARKGLRTAIAVLMLAFMGALVWYGVAFVQFGWNKETMATQIPRGVPYLAVPIGAALFILHLLLFFRSFVRGDFLEPGGPLDPEERSE